MSQIYTPNSAQRASSLYNEFSQAKENYLGSPLTDDWLFDTELVSKIIAELKSGHAADIDGLTADHLKKPQFFKAFNAIFSKRTI